jgi:uncharacterized membrane protein YhdT
MAYMSEDSAKGVEEKKEKDYNPWIFLYVILGFWIAGFVIAGYLATASGHPFGTEEFGHYSKIAFVFTTIISLVVDWIILSIIAGTVRSDHDFMD